MCTIIALLFALLGIQANVSCPAPEPLKVAGQLRFSSTGSSDLWQVGKIPDGEYIVTEGSHSTVMIFSVNSQANCMWDGLQDGAVLMERGEPILFTAKDCDLRLLVPTRVELVFTPTNKELQK